MNRRTFLKTMGYVALTPLGLNLANAEKSDYWPESQQETEDPFKVILRPALDAHNNIRKDDNGEELYEGYSTSPLSLVLGEEPKAYHFLFTQPVTEANLDKAYLLTLGDLPEEFLSLLDEQKRTDLVAEKKTPVYSIDPELIQQLSLFLFNLNEQKRAQALAQNKPPEPPIKVQDLFDKEPAEKTIRRTIEELKRFYEKYYKRKKTNRPTLKHSGRVSPKTLGLA